MMENNYSIEKVIVPPPLTKKIEALEFTDPNIPGEIRVDASGRLLKTFFQYEGTISSLIDQYNNFIEYGITAQITSKTLTVGNGVISYENVVMNRPLKKDITGSMVPLYPQEARTVGYSYTADIYADMVLNKGTPGEERLSKTFIGKLPVMLGSRLDWLTEKSLQEREKLGESVVDPYGYFVIKGAEKIVLIQEKLAANRFFIFNSNSKGNVVCKITNNTLAGSSQITMAKGKKSGAIKVHLAFMGRLNCTASNKLGKTLSVFQIFRLLGVSDVKMILQHLFLFTKPQNIKKMYVALQPTIVKFSKIGDDIEYISKKKGLGDIPYDIKKSDIMRDLLTQLFPQVEPENVQGKLYMLSIMTVRLLEYFIGVRKLDDRDDWKNKQLATAGKSLELLFATIWKEVISMMQNEIDEKKLNSLNSVKAAFRPAFVTDNFIESFTANNWGVQSPNSYMKKENITDILKRDSILSVLSHLTKINTPGSDKSKTVKLRLVQMSQLGYIDAGQTPEGSDCVKIGTPVLLSDGIWAPIENIAEQSVVTVNPETHQKSLSKVINPFKYDTKDREGKKLYRLTTINGRSIEATGDHPFLTERGWIYLNQLDVEHDRVCFYPTQVHVSSEIEDRIILSEDDFVKNLENTGIKESLIVKHTTDLKNMGLLPLKSTYQYLHIISRIIGFSTADCHLGVHVEKPALHGTFGTYEDAENFLNDIDTLGFKKTKILYAENTIVDKETGREAVHHTYRTTKGGSFASLLIALGATYGKKVDTKRKPVPEFIMNGSMLVKREFLAGFQGGDGNCIASRKRKDKVKAHNFTFGNARQHICVQHSMSLYFFMLQISRLFGEFGIKINNVSKKIDPLSKNIICTYQISGEEENIIKYMDNIGYRYATTKNSKSMKVSEFLRYKYRLIQDKIDLKKTVIEMYKSQKPKNIKKIAEVLDITYSQANSIINYWKERGDDTKSLPNPKELIAFNDFWEQNPVKENSYVYLHISKIVEIEGAEVVDFTTISDNHSFVANGFVTHNCGRAKNLAMTAYVSLDRPEEVVVEMVGRYVVGLPTDEQTNPFILNGVFMGWVNGEELRRFCVQMKRSLKLPKDTSIVLERNSFFNIYTDSGRVTRPLLLLNEQGKLIIEEKGLWNADFETLLREGCVEYVSVWEQENIMLAQQIDDIDYRKSEIESALLAVKEAEEKLHFNPEDEKNDKLMLSQAQAALKELTDLPVYTHSEMDPTAIMSIAVGIIPLPETNPGPRLTYQAGMGQQALGIYHSNHSIRFDTSSKIMAYPSRPMFETQLNEIIGLNEFPSGETVTLAIMTYSGFAQEDAIVMAQGAIDRGLFRSIVYKTYKTVLKPNEKLARPEVRKGMENKYLAIGENGIPQLGAAVREGDCLIGKIRITSSGKVEDASSYVEVKQEGVVDRVLVSTNPEGNRVVKVKIRQFRVPVLGDKFACYTPDHEVLTKEGWKSISEITKEDQVFCLNGEETEYRNPSEIQTYDYNGKMYSVKSDKVDLCVTPNHRMYVQTFDQTSDNFEILRAEEIYGKCVNYKNLHEVFTVEGRDEWMDYNGKVYCCSVPSGIIYVRRNGKPVWCGNSRYAQKGTLGMILPDEDMPFTGSGIRPDIIINPLSIPSRMTMGKLIEIVTSKLAGFTGERVNATAFRKFNVKEFMRNLVQYGYSSSGKETMYSGYTGKPMEALIFTGPCYYQVLRHQVSDKIQMRARGGVSQLTRQPVEGRKRGGGLRVGEMERDAIISHGASAFLRERLCLVSDAYETVYCSSCGTMAIANVVEEKYICRSCDEKAHFGTCTVPYAFKMLTQLLMGSGYSVKFKMSEIPK